MVTARLEGLTAGFIASVLGDGHSKTALWDEPCKVYPCADTSSLMLEDHARAQTCAEVTA